MKLDSGGERMFAKVRRFKPMAKPCMEPIEWTIEHGGQPALGDDDAPTAPGYRLQDTRFTVKNGVRQVYISSLDELRQRLDLDETRDVGVAEAEQSAKIPDPNSKTKRPTSGRGRQFRKFEPPPASKGRIDPEIDEEKLGQKIYPGAPDDRNEVTVSEPTSSAEGGLPRRSLPVLRRQDVREVFGKDIEALNQVLFQRTDDGSIDVLELNKDVDLLIQRLSDRLSDDDSRKYLRAFAEAARDPLGEDCAPVEP
jgi:type IV secretion system protein VirD4